MSLFCYGLLCVHSSFAIILKRKRKLVALLLLSYTCIVSINVLWLFLTVGWSAVCDYSGLFRGPNSCRCAAWSLQKILPVHRYSVDIFIEYWVLTGSRIPLKPVLDGVRIYALSIRLNKTESAVFFYCRFSLFLKDPVFWGANLLINTKI